MLQVCAWCRSEIGVIESSRWSERAVSHGICSNCFDNIRFQEGVPLGVYLDSLPAPVYVVDGDGIMTAVNRAGCRALGKDACEIIRRPGGNVFECAYARLPEGCGKTVHCSGCTIRRTVMRTFETGQSQSRVPAVLNHGDPDDPVPIRLAITTVKADGFVVLRVDEMAR